MKHRGSEFDKAVAKNITRQMVQLQMNQATLMRHTGLSEPTIHTIVFGKRGMSLCNADKVAKALGVTVSYLVKDAP